MLTVHLRIDLLFSLLVSPSVFLLVGSKASCLLVRQHALFLHLRRKMSVFCLCGKELFAATGCVCLLACVFV